LSEEGNSLGTFAASTSYQAELAEQYQVLSSMPRSQNRAPLKANTDLEETRPSPTVLLLSDDQALTDFIGRIVKRPWKLVRRGADKYGSREVFAQPSVRLVILDDQTVVENERGWLLAQIRRHFSGTSLLYVAASQSDGNEKRARINGAHYYASKPLSLERFGYVLRSFLWAQQIKR
jgi:DNA-binding NtrC family response regulator